MTELTSIRARLVRLQVKGPLTRRLIGGAVVAVGVFLLAKQLHSVVDKKTALPNIRHFVYWHHDLYEQARVNRNVEVANAIAPFYLIERLLKDTELIMSPTLVDWMWKFEAVGRMRVTLADVVELPASTWSDLDRQASHISMLRKRKLYLLAKDPTVKTYVLVSTSEETGPVYIVPETIYRSRVDTKSGANLSTP